MAVVKPKSEEGEVEGVPARILDIPAPFQFLVYLSNYLSFYQSIYLFIFLYLYPSTSIYIYLSLNLSVCLSIYLGRAEIGGG